MTRKEEIIKIITINPTISYKDLAKIINCSKGTIQYWFKVLNIKRDRKVQQRLNNTDRNSEITITNKAIEILIGTLLGDSHITKYHRNVESKKILNSTISCGHSLKQKKYVLYLKKLLDNEGLTVHFTENSNTYHTSIKNRKITTYGRCDLKTCRNIQFNVWRDLWYPNNLKVVPKDIINHFSALSLAIWYMDDGSKNNQSYYLHTEGFNLEDIEFLKNILLNKFNIITFTQKLRDKYVIYISKKSKNIFKDLIESYVCPSMKYKL